MNFFNAYYSSIVGGRKITRRIVCGEEQSEYASYMRAMKEAYFLKNENERLEKVERVFLGKEDGT